MHVINRIRKLNAYPLSVFFQVLLDKLSFHTVQVASFYLLQFVGIPGAQRGRGPGAVRRGGPSDILQMERLEGSGKEEIFRERFRRGDHCSVAVHREKVIGYEWYTFDSCHREQRYLFPVSIPEDAVFAYDAFIQPEYRVSGIWIKFKAHLGDRMREMGRSRIITLIDCDNKLSVNTHLRFGFKIFRRVFYFRLAGSRFFREMDR